MPAKIYPAAQERILEIWYYTEKKWSEKQADAYVRELVAEIETVAVQRHRWRPVWDGALQGVYFFATVIIMCSSASFPRSGSASSACCTRKWTSPPACGKTRSVWTGMRSDVVCIHLSF